MSEAAAIESPLISNVESKPEVSNDVLDLLEHPDPFLRRHIGPSAKEIEQMLEICGFHSLDALVDRAVPGPIRLKRRLDLPEARSEHEVLQELKTIASRNRIFRSYIGMGYYDCITPPVIRRNILENPGWYTQYTPYQAEIAQGRLEALLNFQTMVSNLTGLEIANASLLDEATAAAEAMHMCYGIRSEEDDKTIFIAADCHPQTIEVVRTRADALGIEVLVGEWQSFDFKRKVFAVLLQYPATDGDVHDYRGFIVKAHSAGAMAIVATDLLSLTLLVPPGEFGADVAVGSSQRFGVPLGYGGPHAAFLATRDSFKRQMPGRLVGVSKDLQGNPALRLALQTREQHIRREKATSNICTAQVLLAIMASMYAVYHGPEGLQQIARRIRCLAQILAAGLERLGYQLKSQTFFDTLAVRLGSKPQKEIIRIAEEQMVNLRQIDHHTLGLSLDETTSLDDLDQLLHIFSTDGPLDFSAREIAKNVLPELPPSFARTSPILAHPVFNRYHSETEMLRYIRRLESRDLSLTTSMIPLGSCTMKLNATAEMLPITWPELSNIHPFATPAQAAGYKILFDQLQEWLAEITGFDAVSLQPNAGSQGEFAGLLVIRQYHNSRGESHRNICLIPQSAHGTNPASAVMSGLKVVVVACDEQGSIDLANLKAKAEFHRSHLSALMVTYPSTHGVFEETIKEICQIVHENGGQVYMDGANMNAQVGLCRPGDVGADVCHLNLHKTFCIPHGGGGPGMGPICVASHLAPFLPTHPVVRTGGEAGIGAIAAAPWGSASILVIPWVYIKLMGAEGLTEAAKVAMLNANYIAKRLEYYFPALYKGHGDLVAHECILDLRQFKSISVEDVAKRLMDYSFHAPTISWPVPGTMMIEPTESESKEELDRFCEAMIAIHSEIQEIESGQVDRADNLLKNAPHTAPALMAEKWERPYSRERAAYPAKWVREHKFWPAVGRIDNAYGDRNPVCTCPAVEEFL